MEKVPTLYQSILRRLYNSSDGGKIEIFKARRLISMIFKIPKQKLFKVFRELQEMDAIEFSKRRYILILYHPPEETWW